MGLVLTEELKVPLPPESAANKDRKLQLVVQAVHILEPTWTDIDANRALHRVMELEKPEWGKDMVVDEDCLTDVVSNVEAKKVKVVCAEMRLSAREKEVHVLQRATAIHAVFKNTSLKASAKSKLIPRWLPPKSPSNLIADAWLQRNKPDYVDVILDAYNGRFRVVASTGDWRSISYTKRGLKSCVQEVLWQAWTYHFFITGRTPHFDLDELLATFDDDE